MTRSVMAAMAAVAVVAAQDQRGFRTSVDVVSVNVTVRDNHATFVSGLTKDDFTILEDGQPRSAVYFAGESAPLSLGILLDASGSMTGDKLSLAKSFITRLVTDHLDPVTEWMFARFTSTVVATPEWTTDRAAIVQPLRETRATGDTSLYDAVSLTIPLVQEGHFQKKALLLVSDGGETKSLLSLDDVQKAIGLSDIPVYGVGVNAQMKTMRRVADDTGGWTYEVSTSASIAAAAAEVADALRHQYLLGYTTKVARDGRRHAIRVEVHRPRVTVRTRRAFVAD